MIKLLVTAAITAATFSAFAGGAPAPITIKCEMSTTKGAEQEVLSFEYGSGQQILAMSGAEKIIVEVSDNNALEAGLHDVKVYLNDSILSAKSVTVSKDQSHGIHIVRTSKGLSSIFCGI